MTERLFFVSGYRIYRYQTHDYAFSSNERLLHALGGNDFTRLLNQTIDEALQKAGFSHKFINEVVCPAMRVNYGQGVTVNAFVGTCFVGLSLQEMSRGPRARHGGGIPAPGAAAVQQSVGYKSLIFT